MLVEKSRVAWAAPAIKSVNILIQILRETIVAAQGITLIHHPFIFSAFLLRRCSSTRVVAGGHGSTLGSNLYALTRDFSCCVLSLLVLLIIVFGSASSQAQTKALALSAEDVAGQLKKGYGYLVINLEAGGTAPSITLHKNSGRKWKIALKDKEPGIYIAPLRKGEYQIVRVDAPYFSLPFYLETKEKDAWKFVIVEKRMNYIGKLHIDRERSVNFINIRLLNRIAVDRRAIQQSFPNLLAGYPLMHLPGYRDDFYQEYAD